MLGRHLYRAAARVDLVGVVRLVDKLVFAWRSRRDQRFGSLFPASRIKVRLPFPVVPGRTPGAAFFDEADPVPRIRDAGVVPRDSDALADAVCAITCLYGDR